MFEILKKNNTIREYFRQLGDSLALSPELQAHLKEFACLLYTPNHGTTDIISSAHATERLNLTISRLLAEIHSQSMHK